MKIVLLKVLGDESGAAASEYAILVAVVAVAVYVAVKEYIITSGFQAAGAKVGTCVNATGTSC